MNVQEAVAKVRGVAEYRAEEEASRIRSETEAQTAKQREDAEKRAQEIVSSISSSAVSPEQLNAMMANFGGGKS